jgi:hypothetical protein
MEQRKKIGSILLRPASKEPVSVEIYPAELWAEGSPGLYRLRVAGAWLRTEAEQYYFLTLEGLGLWLARHFAALVGAQAAQPQPDLPRHSLVGVESPDFTSNLTRTATAPIQGIDGRWYTVVSIFGQGMVHVPVEECRVRDKHHK